MNKIRNLWRHAVVMVSVVMLVWLAAISVSDAFWGGKFKTLTSQKDQLLIPVKSVSDGRAHYFQTRSADGIMVKFFVVQSSDGVIRAAIDACDVCYRSGKGYVQDGPVMICSNCGMRFAAGRINDVKGGCNPAPLKREIQGGNLVISMADINENAWYCKYK